MPTDYQLPPEWNSFTPEEKDAWFHEERARRQAMRQNTPYRRRVLMEIEKMEKRNRFRKTKFLGKRE